ncbi:MAG: hypothetical protein PHQ12_07485 [Chthoniobacteraceae bacterium]|nr:hypothetical protein [Chthoniobacteraceae bacterium]
MTKAKARFHLYARLQALGLSYDEADQLRRIEMTLQRWGELECGDSDNYGSQHVERDETTGKTFLVYQPHTSNERSRTPIPDREGGALKRLAKIMAAHPGLVSYHQSDPRGCALYILRKSDLNGSPIDQVYPNGVAVCS